MLSFIGTGKVKSESLEEVKDAILRFMPSIQDEEGTLTYIVYQHREDPSRIVFYEIYRDQEAKKEHNANPELKKMMDVLEPALEGEVVKGFFDVIAEKA